MSYPTINLANKKYAMNQLYYDHNKKAQPIRVHI